MLYTQTNILYASTSFGAIHTLLFAARIENYLYAPPRTPTPSANVETGNRLRIIEIAGAPDGIRKYQSVF